MKAAKRIPGAVLFLLICLSLSAAVSSGFLPEKLPELRPIIVLAVAAVVLALSWTRVGTAFLFLLGSILCAGANFLQFPIPLWSLLLFAASTLCMYFWRGILRSENQAAAGGVSTGSACLSVAMLSLLSLAVAAGLYLVVVRPLAPPTRELKLVTQLRSMTLLQVLGVSRTEIILDADPEHREEEPPEEQKKGELPGETESDAIDDRQEREENTEPPEEGETDSGREEAESLRYDLPPSRTLWPLLLIPLLIAALLALRAYRRKRWRRLVAALPPEEAVVNYYSRMLSLLSRVGLRRAERQTLREFAGMYRDGLAVCFPESDFRQLTEIYERAFYAMGGVSPREKALVEEAYSRLPAALRRELGPLRYALTAFRG